MGREGVGVGGLLLLFVLYIIFSSLSLFAHHYEATHTMYPYLFYLFPNFSSLDSDSHHMTSSRPKETIVTFAPYSYPTEVIDFLDVNDVNLMRINCS